MHQHKSDPRPSSEGQMLRAIELLQGARHHRSQGCHKDAARMVLDAMRELSECHQTLWIIGQGER